VPRSAKSVELRPSPENSKTLVPYYRVVMREFSTRLHPDFQPTRLWGFDGMCPGPAFQTHSGSGLLVEWVNMLPSQHLLEIDHAIHGADLNLPEVRTVVHLHGAKVRPESDGYPENWFVPGASALYYYPCQQDATLLWYHDHALGITRLNIYAGLFGTFIIRDELERRLNLPDEAHEIPLVICDRQLGASGRLQYSESHSHSGGAWVSEFYGGLLLVNGKWAPFLEVEPRKYRFRIVNVSNGRFLSLSLSGAMAFTQIGCDQGLLPAPIETTSMRLAPAERADVVVDFRALQGERIELQANATSALQFRVLKTRVEDTSTMPRVLRPLSDLGPAIKTRTLTLDEERDRFGKVTITLLNKTRWHMAVTENPVIDSVEIWNLVNLTRDLHPIHLHLVRFLIIDRRSFDADTFKRGGH